VPRIGTKSQTRQQQVERHAPALRRRARQIFEQTNCKFKYVNKYKDNIETNRMSYRARPGSIWPPRSWATAKSIEAKDIPKLKIIIIIQ
jgi:hypothetical protein